MFSQIGLSIACQNARTPNRFFHMSFNLAFVLPFIVNFQPNGFGALVFAVNEQLLLLLVVDFRCLECVPNFEIGNNNTQKHKAKQNVNGSIAAIID